MKNLFRTIKPSRSSNFFSRNLFSLSTMRFGKPQLALRPFTLTTPLVHGMSTSNSDHQNIMKSSYEGSGYYVEQMLTGCLAIYSYYIESGN